VPVWPRLKSVETGASTATVRLVRIVDSLTTRAGPGQAEAGAAADALAPQSQGTPHRVGGMRSRRRCRVAGGQAEEEEEAAEEEAEEARALAGRRTRRLHCRLGSGRLSAGRYLRQPDPLQRLHSPASSARRLQPQLLLPTPLLRLWGLAACLLGPPRPRALPSLQGCLRAPRPTTSAGPRRTPAACSPARGSMRTGEWMPVAAA
jgi:hypothetical protein